MQGIETPELHVVLQQLVLPELSVAELGTLQCTSRALRDVVETADIALWQAAALPVLGLYHPALSSTHLGCLSVAKRHYIMVQGKLMQLAESVSETHQDRQLPALNQDTVPAAHEAVNSSAMDCRQVRQE